MKRLLSFSLLGAGLLLAGCETTVLQPNDRDDSYVDGGYRNDGYVEHYDDGSNGHRRSNHQTNVYQTNVTENNVTENNITRERNVTNRSVKASPRSNSNHPQHAAKPHPNQHPASAPAQPNKGNGKKKHGGNPNNQN